MSPVVQVVVVTGSHSMPSPGLALDSMNEETTREPPGSGLAPPSPGLALVSMNEETTREPPELDELSHMWEYEPDEPLSFNDEPTPPTWSPPSWAANKETMEMDAGSWSPASEYHYPTGNQGEPAELAAELATPSELGAQLRRCGQLCSQLCRLSLVPRRVVVLRRWGPRASIHLHRLLVGSPRRWRPRRWCGLIVEREGLIGLILPHV